MRACSSGRLEGVSSTRIASRGRRSASAASTWPARSGSAGVGRGRRGGPHALAAPDPLARPDRVGERGADGGRLADHRELDRAAVRLGGVVR